MCRPERVVLELTYDELGAVMSKANLKFVDLRHNFINIEGWLITEAKILCDAIETGQRFHASNHIAVHLFYVRHG